MQLAAIKNCPIISSNSRRRLSRLFSARLISIRHALVRRIPRILRPPPVFILARASADLVRRRLAVLLRLVDSELRSAGPLDRCRRRGWLHLREGVVAADLH